MQINTHNITITDDEKDILGIALEQHLKGEMKNSTRLKFDTYKELCEEEISMLRQFVYMGYTLTIKKESKENCFDFENTTDVEKWLKNEWEKKDMVN